MSSTRAVAEKIVRHIQVETGELRSDMWASIATDSIDAALTQREAAVRAEERERCAVVADTVAQDWYENAAYTARADSMAGGLAATTYRAYARIAEKIAAAIRNPSQKEKP